MHGQKTQDVHQEVRIEDADAIRSVRAMTQEFEYKNARNVKGAPVKTWIPQCLVDPFVVSVACGRCHRDS